MEINMRRANRTAVERTEDGYVAKFYKTHTMVGQFSVTNAEWQPSEGANPTKAREEFRDFAISHCKDIDVEWLPELQAQAWDRKYWKYENDSQVEEDAIELMTWTINKAISSCKYTGHVDAITLDSIVAQSSDLSYVDKGKYTKNGNWAEAIVNLNVELTVNETVIDIIWAIDMRSGQLAKVKLTKVILDQMIADAGIEEVAVAQ